MIDEENNNSFEEEENLEAVNEDPAIGNDTQRNYLKTTRHSNGI